MKTFTVEIRVDYLENKGNPVSSEAHSFDTIEEAEKAYQEALMPVDDENGILTIVSLYVGTDDDLFDKQLKSESRNSKELPTDGVIVYYRHHRYMGYAFQVKEIETVADSRKTTYLDLPYSEDNTFATWATVYNDIVDFVTAYELGEGEPFNKLNSGSRVVREFLEEQKYPGYFDVEEEEEEIDNEQ